MSEWEASGEQQARAVADGDDRRAQVPRLAEQVHFVPVGVEAVLLDTDGDRLSELNSSAAVVCALIDGHRSVEAIGLDCADTFGESPAVVGPGVQAIVDRLVEEGLVVLTTAR